MSIFLFFCYNNLVFFRNCFIIFFVPKAFNIECLDWVRTEFELGLLLMWIFHQPSEPNLITSSLWIYSQSSSSCNSSYCKYFFMSVSIIEATFIFKIENVSFYTWIGSNLLHSTLRWKTRNVSNYWWFTLTIRGNFKG